jgi:hypothetical protein
MQMNNYLEASQLERSHSIIATQGGGVTAVRSIGNLSLSGKFRNSIQSTTGQTTYYTISFPGHNPVSASNFI